MKLGDVGSCELCAAMVMLGSMGLLVMFVLESSDDSMEPVICLELQILWLRLI